MRTRFLLFGCFATLLTFSLLQTEALSQGESILERFERRSRTNDLEGVAEPFTGITRDGSVEDGLFSIQSTGVSTEPVRRAAEAFPVDFRSAMGAEPRSPEQPECAGFSQGPHFLHHR